MAARSDSPDGRRLAAAVLVHSNDSMSGIETEVKFSSTPAGLQQAQDWSGFGAGTPAEIQTLRSNYFDTPGRDLLRQGIVLRVRRSDHAAQVMTVKMPAKGRHGPFHRSESEVRIKGMTPRLDLFEPDVAADLLHITAGQVLELQFETRVKRHTRHLESNGAKIEVAFDEGMIVLPDGRNMPLCEIELELKSGPAGSLYNLAYAAADALPLTLDVVSKSEKGYRLKSGSAPDAVKAVAPELDGKQTLDQLVIAVLASTLMQFVSNWAPLLQSDSTESVHQLRVSLRRMRSALKIFRRKLPCPEFEASREDAKQIATALGKARNLDVMRDDAVRGPLSCATRPDGCDTLMTLSQHHRDDAYESARVLISSRRATLIVLRLQATLASHIWRAGARADVLSMPAHRFAVDALDWLHHRSMKRGTKLLQRSDAERHALRIALKDLRYGIEFFSSLFGHTGKVRNALRLLGILQDVLGANNDVVTAAQLLQEISKDGDPDVLRAAGFVAGWQARSIPSADDSLLRVWKEFKSMKPFWR
jgi:triphosphatase